MLELCAPVSCDLCLCAQGTDKVLKAAEWEEIIAELGAQANEFKLRGVEGWHEALEKSGKSGKDEIAVLLAALEKAGRCFHVCFDASKNWIGFPRSNFFRRLIGCACLGTLIFEFPDTDSLEELISASGAEEAVQSGFEICFSVVLGPEACGAVQDLTDEALDAGASFVIFERPEPENDGGRESRAAVAAAAAEVKELRDLGSSVSLSSCFPNCFSGMDTPGCMAGNVKCAVSCEGKLLPCRYCARTEETGRVTAGKLSEAWETPLMRRWRAFLGSACNGCSRQNLCAGGCPARADMEKNCADPLVCMGAAAEENTLQEVTLEDELCPVPRYRARKEKFGWLLMRGGRVIPVSFKAEPVLAMLDGKFTLADVEDKFGSGALSFIYSLYVRGFVDFKQPS